MERLIAPSILASDFSDIAGAIKLIETAGGDWVHLDVMDGSFVPPITFGSQMVQAIDTITDLPLDVHLMIERPENHIEDFAAAGADYLTVHAEATVHLHRLIQRISDLGVKPGVSIVPSTPVSALQEILGEVDLVLVMSVNPGYGGQKLIPGTLKKIEQLQELKQKHGYRYRISIDGGVNGDTVSEVRDAGAEVMVAGSAFFKADNPSQVVAELKGSG